MKKYIRYLIIFLFFLIPNSCFAVVGPSKEFYINDYANILSAETEEYILNRSLALNEVDGTQIVVVTVPNLEGMSLESYAYQLFNSFGIGDKDKNNGLLLLLALEEREFRVEVGDGLGGILPDGKTGRFQDEYMIPYLKENKWDEGIKNGYDAFYSEIVELNNLNIDYSKPVEYYVDIHSDENSYIPLLFCGVPILGMLTGLTVRISKKNKKSLITIYLSICGLLAIYGLFFSNYLLFFVFFYLFYFLVIAFGKSGSTGRGSYGRSRYSGRSHSSSSGSSFGGFSGGGGRSSGGGSSRRF